MVFSNLCAKPRRLPFCQSETGSEDFEWFVETDFEDDKWYEEDRNSNDDFIDELEEEDICDKW